MLIPSRLLVLAAAVPLALAIIGFMDESVRIPMLIADAGIILIALADALMSLRPKLRATRRCPEVFSIGRANPVEIELRSLARRRFRVQVTSDLFDHADSPELPLTCDLGGRGRETLRFRVVPRKRGAYELGDIHLRYRSVLGLWIRQLDIPAEDPVRVYPDVQAVRTWELMAREDRQHSLMRTSRRLGGENEFEQLREYSRDDEFRSIDWRATARKGKIIARQYQLESNQNLMFLLDGGRLMTAETEGISLFDHALNAVLMLAHVATRGGDRVGLMAYADHVQSFVAPQGGRKAVQKLIKASYDLHPELVEVDHEAAFQLLNLKLRARSLAILFTQVLDDRAGEELLRTTRALMPRHLPLIVVFRDTEVDALLDARPSAKKGDAYLRGAAAELISWRQGVLRKLRNSGALVLDISATGLTPALINRYLEIKARHLL
jgi:uncharacterized protein (DUF58 family)